MKCSIGSTDNPLPPGPKTDDRIKKSSKLRLLLIRNPGCCAHIFCLQSGGKEKCHGTGKGTERT